VSALGTAPEGYRWDAEGVQAFGETAAALGVSAEEATRWISYVAQHATGPPPDADVTEATLKREWGDRYEANMEAARFVAHKRLSANDRYVLREHPGLQNDPAIIRRLAEVGRPLLEAKEKIRKIQENPGHPYHNPSHPAHATFVAEVGALYRTVYGDR